MKLVNNEDDNDDVPNEAGRTTVTDTEVEVNEGTKGLPGVSSRWKL